MLVPASTNCVCSPPSLVTCLHCLIHIKGSLYAVSSWFHIYYKISQNTENIAIVQKCHGTKITDGNELLRKIGLPAPGLCNSAAVVGGGGEGRSARALSITLLLISCCKNLGMDSHRLKINFDYFHIIKFTFGGISARTPSILNLDGE